MPLPTNAPDDCLHRFNCSSTFARIAPKAWEFLFYIPNPHHPIQDDGHCRSHFCLVLPDVYKIASYAQDNRYRAIALVTRTPRSCIRHQGCLILRPHTASCTCPKRPGELGTSVVNRVSDGLNDTLCVFESPCHLYHRSDVRNRGHFETWSWYDNSVIPIQAPKMVRVESLHLLRPLTQPKFGLILNPPHMVAFDVIFGRFKDLWDLSTREPKDEKVQRNERPKLVRAWSDVARKGIYVI